MRLVLLKSISERQFVHMRWQPYSLTFHKTCVLMNVILKIDFTHAVNNGAELVCSLFIV